jgi:hypothetical protein
MPKLDTLVFNDLHGCASPMALSKAFGACALAKKHGWRRNTPADSRPKQFRIALSHLLDFHVGALNHRAGSGCRKGNDDGQTMTAMQAT